MRERDFEKILVAEVHRLGGRAYKWVSPGNAGVPDRIVIFPERRPIFVELKAEGGKLSPLQKVQIEKLCSLGQFATVVQGAHGLMQFFEYCGYLDAASRIALRFDL